MSTPERSYVVCGTQRSGTTLLCWALADTGRLGRPDEYVTTRQGFVELVYRLGTSDNGIFGIELMWNNLPWVQIIRRDRVGQAISWAKAAQDGVWVATSDAPAMPSGQPVYDFDLINGLERLIVEGETGWRDLFRELELQPFEVAAALSRGPRRVRALSAAAARRHVEGGGGGAVRRPSSGGLISPTAFPSGSAMTA